MADSIAPVQREKLNRIAFGCLIAHTFQIVCHILQLIFCIAIIGQIVSNREAVQTNTVALEINTEHLEELTEKLTNGDAN